MSQARQHTHACTCTPAVKHAAVCAHATLTQPQSIPPGMRRKNISKIWFKKKKAEKTMKTCIGFGIFHLLRFVLCSQRQAKTHPGNVPNLRNDGRHQFEIWNFSFFCRFLIFELFFPTVPSRTPTYSKVNFARGWCGFHHSCAALISYSLFINYSVLRLHKHTPRYSYFHTDSSCQC